MWVIDFAAESPAQIADGLRVLHQNNVSFQAACSSSMHWHIAHGEIGTQSILLNSSQDLATAQCKIADYGYSEIKQASSDLRAGGRYAVVSSNYFICVSVR